jgi:uncharacterized protein (DUF4415 family)
MKKPPIKPEMIEGPEALERFESTMRQVLSVSKDELNRRLAAEKIANTGKPKRGPKKKTAISKPVQ